MYQTFKILWLCHILPMIKPISEGKSNVLRSAKLLIPLGQMAAKLFTFLWTQRKTCPRPLFT